MQTHQTPTFRNSSRLSLVRPERELKRSTKAETKSTEQTKAKQQYSSKVKVLAEAVILQAVEDLWSKTHRRKSIEFFTGAGFKEYADMAGMGPVDRLRLIKMIGKTSRPGSL